MRALAQDDRDTLRQVFLGSESGKRALGMLLFELGFFSPAETEATRATKNFATNLAKNVASGDENELMGLFINSLAGHYALQPKTKEDR